MKNQIFKVRKFAPAASIALVVLMGMVGCGKHSDGNPQGVNGATAGLELRIGYGKGGAPDIVRRQGTLEKRLAPLGVRVSWLQFPMGPQMMEAIGAGSLDLGAAASTPPLFAQAAGVPFVYAANTPPSKPYGAILLPRNSPIHSLRDLEGKRIAFQPGSVWQYDLVKLLEQVGLEYKDIQPIKLPPADASSAFNSGSIDAWVQGEPYITLAARKSGAHVLVDTSSVPNDGWFYLAAAAIVKAHPELIRAALEELKRASDWSLAHPHDAAVLTASDVGLDAETLEKTYAGASNNTFRPIDDAIIRQQQEQADLFCKLGVMPKKIDVRTVVLSPQQYAQLLPRTGIAGNTASVK